MSRYSQNRFLPILLTVIIMIIAVVALVSLARAIFFSNSGPGQADLIDTSRQSLLSTDIGRSVRMTVRGPIVADENFNSYRIVVSPTSRKLETYSGYLERTIDQISLSNNSSAYEEFVHALDKADLPVGTQFEADRDDTRGICATGRVYEYEIINGDNIVKRLWTSTCKGSPGSLRASADQLTNLFTTQIPDAREPLRKIKI